MTDQPGQPGQPPPAECRAHVVPPAAELRRALRAAADAHSRRAALTPPLSLEELTRHAEAVLAAAGADMRYMPFAAVLASNAAWAPAVAGIPYERRLVLLPQCLRDADECPAEIDEYGLLCRHCGRCVLHSILAEAEALGCVTLVCEGTAAVISLIESGQVEVVIGVGCMDSLEKVFPLMQAAAIPAVAIPLLHAGCRNTALDMDWLMETIRAYSGPRTAPTGLEPLAGRVREWFTPEALAEVMGPPADETERIARDWMCVEGKRWRPTLAAAAYDALEGDADCQAIRAAAVAVECFHKASLIHDDIEDGDATRYGLPTLHERFGVPVALNAGDLLLGEGYRLLAGCDAPPETRAAMLRAAADAHRRLCLGQGAELCWARGPRPLRTAEVAEIYANKTAPAFEVALRMGALLAGAEDAFRNALDDFSRALGIAYQVRDDREDLHAGDLPAMRPSLLLADAWQRADGASRDAFEKLWRREARAAELETVRAALREMDVDARAGQLLERHKRQALAALEPVTHAALKALLRRVVAKICGELDELGTEPAEPTRDAARE